MTGMGNSSSNIGGFAGAVFVLHLHLMLIAGWPSLREETPLSSTSWPVVFSQQLIKGSQLTPPQSALVSHG